MNSVKPMGTDPKIYPYLHIFLREKTHPYSPHILPGVDAKDDGGHAGQVE